MEDKAVIPPLTISAQSPDTDLSISHSVLSLVPFNLAVEYFILPIGITDSGHLEAIMAYPHDAEVVQCMQMHTGLLIRPREVSKEQLLKLINRHYGPYQQRQDGAESQAHASKQRLVYSRTESTMTLMNNLLHEAIRLRASDIHLEPFERDMCVRFRVDGVLQEIMSIPAERVPELTSRVKVLAGMDIAIKRRAQDGRIRIAEQGRDVDIRVSTLPTDFGEKSVLRLLDKSGMDYNLESLGMDQPRLAMFKRAIQMPNGIILITGPTGSGKTTTLYAVMNFLKRPDINISSVEDPIEYNIPGVNQTQVNQLAGMSFANTLRTLLRQDPDVIMVGEMRDQETAEIAVRSSLTGHLVMSTLHTNDAPSAITRLIDMGVEHYLVSSSLAMVVAQRLVRRICVHCKCEDMVSDQVKKNIGLPPDAVMYKGLGCSECGYTGYRGRTGIFEVLPVTDSIRRLIQNKPFVTELRDRALGDGMVTLRENALAKLREGITSIEEVLREISVIS